MINVEIYRHDLATVTITPSLVARILFRASATERFVVRSGSSWCWDDTGRLVPSEVARAIERAWFEARMQPRLVRAAAPPS